VERIFDILILKFLANFLKQILNLDIVSGTAAAEI